jgi:hypothetical protein
MVLLCWAIFWIGVCIGFVACIGSTCDLSNIGWYYHDIFLHKRHVHRNIGGRDHYDNIWDDRGPYA